ncbi:ABC transporter substrate-binding protein [Metabacillus arenae]|uniref:Extracellular solute-binding protein n=1 Tax=Metabacillus arenae TaxID=2771434 RepID=A0A926S072_9BACI|nr:extracellular solute-binding protein [Metabacillus arenae]MBD1383600.1 extracellular solute-binding protein [Metabacillus arenae]
MRKTFVLTVFAMMFGLLFGCSSGNNVTSESTPSNSNSNNNEEKTTLKIFQFKTEIVEQLKQLEQEYESEHPTIDLEIESITGTDYETKLKAKFAAGDMPDIFMNEGYADLDNWLEHVEDLSNEPWVEDIIDVAREPMERDGKTYGMPVTLEGIGFGYNKDLFESAGIKEVPTTISELEEAAQKLQDSGINAFINNYNSYFPLAMHAFNNPIAKHEDPTAFIKGLNEGTAKLATDELTKQWTDLIQLTIKYGNKDGIITDHNTARTMFINEEYAIMQTGNWNDPVIVEMNPDMNVGFMPMPINDDSTLNDTIFVGVPNNWAIYKDSPNKDKAKDFLNWLVTSETGKRYITEEFRFIPALKSIEASSELGPISKEIVRYIEEDKVLGWQWAKYPEGVLQLIGDSIQKFIAGKIDADQMLEEFDKAWQQSISKN